MKDPQVWQAIAAIIAAYAAVIGGIYAVVTKPLMMTQAAMQTQFGSIQTQLTDIITRLGRIETKLDDHATRITRLEERTSPFRH